jgi:hypothetical protein
LGLLVLDGLPAGVSGVSGVAGLWWCVVDVLWGSVVDESCRAYVVLADAVDQVGELLAAGEWGGVDVDVECCAVCVESGEDLGVAFWAVFFLGCLAGSAAGAPGVVLVDLL